MTRSRSCTKPTATVLAIRFAAGSYASRIRLSLVKSPWYFANKGTGENVAEEEDGPHDLMRLDAAGDDALGHAGGHHRAADSQAAAGKLLSGVAARAAAPSREGAHRRGRRGVLARRLHKEGRGIWCRRLGSRCSAPRLGCLFYLLCSR